MSLEQLTQVVQAKATANLGLGAKIKFDLGSEGKIFLDATSMSPSVSNEDADADAVIVISAENMGKLMAGKLDPTMAYMTGKLKIKGSMGVAMKLNSMLGD